MAVTVKKACALIGVGNTTMYELVRDGRVKTTTIEHAEADAPDHSPNSRPGEREANPRSPRERDGGVQAFAPSR